MIKSLLLLIILFLYILYKILVYKFGDILEFSDIMSIISLLVDILVPIGIVYFLQNKFLVNRNLKDYHLRIFEELLKEYNVFLEDLASGKFNRREVANKFKIFSIRFTFMDDQILGNLKINVSLQELNRELQIYVTSSSQFNNTVTNSKVRLNHSSITKINQTYSKLLERNAMLIKKIHC